MSTTIDTELRQKALDLLADAAALFHEAKDYAAKDEVYSCIELICYKDDWDDEDDEDSDGWG